VVVNYRSGAGREFFRRYGWLAAPIFRLASAVTAPSRFLAEAIHQRFGVPVQIVPNIVDLIAFRYRPRKHFNPRLLVTRHLELMYGVDSVIRAFSRIQKSYPEASLDIAGTGSQEMNLRQLVVELSLRNVRFCGHVPHSELPPFYEGADILMNGSHVDNFPGSLLEASAAGLVVVSTNAGGISALYENERTAILVGTGDWKGLADGVLKIVEDASIGIALTSAAIEICRRCEWRNVRRCLYESYGVSMPAERQCALEA
jgi:glycosyltransferase involved in cell wall biosynthesis